jgi:hypothetical protein
MPILAGRRAFYAALAVPIAMVIAPLTATAAEAGGTVVTEQAQPGAVVTENEAVTTAAVRDFGGPPDWYLTDDADVVHSESEDTQVTYVVNGIHDDTVIGNSAEQTTVVQDGDDGYGDDVDVVHSESEDTQVTYVINGIYDDSAVGNSSVDTTVVSSADSGDGFSPGPDWYWADDVDVVHSESEDTQVTYVVNGIHDDTVIGNSDKENIHVTDGMDDYVVDDRHGDTGIGVHADHPFDDDTTYTSFEELSVGAGEGGAYVDSVESGSFTRD